MSNLSLTKVCSLLNLQFYRSLNRVLKTVQVLLRDVCDSISISFYETFYFAVLIRTLYEPGFIIIMGLGGLRPPVGCYSKKSIENCDGMTINVFFVS